MLPSKFLGKNDNPAFLPTLIRSLWFWSAATVLFLVWIPSMALVRLTDRDPFLRRSGRFLRVLGRMFTRVYPGRIRLSGVENIDRAKAYVIVSNHQSLADGPLSAHIPLDQKSLLRVTLLDIPVVGWLLGMSGEIPIDRSNPRTAARGLQECARHLRAGCSVLIFPEGTRSKDGELLPYNDTPFRLAIKEGAPVLPVVLEGAGKALPKKSLLFTSGEDIHVRILPPIAVEGINPKESGALRDQVWNLVNGELQRLRG